MRLIRVEVSRVLGVSGGETNLGIIDFKSRAEQLFQMPY